MGSAGIPILAQLMKMQLPIASLLVTGSTAPTPTGVLYGVTNVSYREHDMKIRQLKCLSIYEIQGAWYWSLGNKLTKDDSQAIDHNGPFADPREAFEDAAQSSVYPKVEEIH